MLKHFKNKGHKGMKGSDRMAKALREEQRGLAMEEKGKRDERTDDGVERRNTLNELRKETGQGSRNATPEP